MGPIHGKDSNNKFHHLRVCLFKTVHSDKNLNGTYVDSPVVVWSDGSIGKNSNSNDDLNTLIQLGHIVNKQRKLIHTFNELDQCQDFIKCVNNVFLIVSGTMGQQLVPLIHDLEQIHSIYIFCMNKHKYESWTKQYRKIEGVFTKIEDLCECLRKYFIGQSLSECEKLQFDLVSRNILLQKNDERELSFLYAILSKVILANMNSIKQQDMIDYCRMENKNKNHEKLIDQLKNDYGQHNPVWWFTRDNFLREIINRALQLHDFLTLCMMSPFLNDLNDKLEQLYRQQLSSSSDLLHLYFSQSVSNDEFMKLRTNKNGLMCINEFLFANTDRNIPLMFLEHQTFKCSPTNNVNVLFKICVSQTNESNALYANIGTVSQFVHEKDYLISMSSIYRIGNVEALPEIPSVWLIHLTLLDQDDQELINCIQDIDTDEFCEDDYLALVGSNISDKLNQFKSTRKLCEQTLKPGAKHIRPILLHYNMGIIYDALNDFNTALHQYKSAIKLIRDYEQHDALRDNLLFAPIYSNMGLTYQKMNMTSHAFDHVFRALTVISNHPENSLFHSELSFGIYFNLGYIVHQQGQICEAKSYYEHALKSLQKYLPNDHPTVIKLHDILNSLKSEEETSKHSD
ncbi:unnamed protein product [Rotaria socialis]|uniref:Uncharacterized protein n=2 Tax=Rotaria socialis TaxID=392032 RepID=A0A821KG90_9BILA|nr:unnamed protein product [Rotaria socialis]CAF4735585.1 unnamed protein product [Rotaria socialis]